MKEGSADSRPGFKERDSPPAGGAARPDGAWQLEGTDGDGRPVRLIFGETELRRAYPGLTIGRHPMLCDLVVDDPTVSRRHLRVSRTGAGLCAEDLNSLNGTYLDGLQLQPFQPTVLREGQTLGLGRVALRLVWMAA